MQPLETGGLTAETIKAALHSATRSVKFRYEILDNDNVSIGQFKRVQGATVTNNTFADIKRVAKFDMLEGEDEVDWLNVRIRPWFQLKIGAVWVEWPLGIFLISTPTRNIQPSVIARSIEAYDQALILKEDLVDSRYSIAAGAVVTTEVVNVLVGAGITRHGIPHSAETLTVAREWEIGTPKLQIVNDLLTSIGYTSLYFTSAGSAMAEPYVVPEDRAVGYTYAADSLSVLSPNAEHEMDLFGVPNKWVLVVSDTEQDPLVSIYTNDSPTSPTSTVNRGRTITDFRSDVEATSQAALDAQALRLAAEASQVFEYVSISTALMPHHEDADVIELDYEPVGAKARFVEAEWDMPLKAGALMTHRLRKVVMI